MSVVDLFAGPGGADLGMRHLGLDPLGIEWDDAACQTREAAGLRTVQADVSQLDPRDFGPVEGLWGSPPCQDYSAAGKRAGLAGESGMLIHEVMRWARVLEPGWIACEQVPPALPVWQLFAAELSKLGYRTWAGLLHAEEHGVPQTRTRAFLMATKGELALPEPTHTRYRPRLPDRGWTPPEPGMWGRQLRPWVSMAEALGWGCTHAPAGTITAGSSRQGGPDPLDGGSGAREFYRREQREGRWVLHTNRDQRADGERQVIDPYARPAPALTAKSGGQWVLRSRRDSPGWVEEHGERPNRHADEPAPAITGEAHRWAWESPATTVAGDPRITARCHHDDGSQGANAKTTEQVRAGDYEGTEPIRLTVEEAAVLQSYPPGHPWQGSKTAKFTQIGNSVPPPLAAAVVGPLIGALADAA